MQLVRYNEVLSIEELAFLQRKEVKERRQYYKFIRVVMGLCFAIPFVVSWFRAAAGAEDPFAYEHYFLGVGFLCSFSGTCIYIAYNRNLKKVQSDIKHRTKTIEMAHITRKQFMPHNASFHFYLDSPNKLSIEVNEKDYQRLTEGDEVNIEYTTHSKMYLGYF